MQSIITTTTTTTVVSLSQAAVYGAIGVIVLIALLITKELSTSEAKKAMLLGRITGVAIYPLLFVFLMIVAVKIIEVL